MNAICLPQAIKKPSTVTDFPTIPRHIAVIMDGNGRWAKERGLPRREGHRAGAESVREIMEACKELGVEYLTLFAFSSENWSRPAAEVLALMTLLERFLREKAKDLDTQNVRLQAIGQLDRLPAKTRTLLDSIIARTAGHTALTMVLASTGVGAAPFMPCISNIWRICSARANCAPPPPRPPCCGNICCGNAGFMAGC